MDNLVFLKLGGSLITDKTQTSTPHIEVIERLAEEIANARRQNPNLKLLLGHGSGSFGHVPAKKYGTRQGVQTAEEWRGFAEVWLEASALNRIMIEALHQADLPAIAFPASAAATGEDGQVKDWDIGPIQKALAQGLLPLVFGDVAFDSQRGGTIFSTEDIFNYLAHKLKPQQILLAGLDEGVYADYPENSQLLPEITPDTLEKVAPALGSSAATDVTGGMASKVKEMLALAQALPGLEVQIFSGVPQDQVFQALLGAKPGTCLHA